MEKLSDTQNESDDRGIAIQRVGVKAIKFPVAVSDRDSKLQHTVATVSLAVDLPADRKGTHMSRFVEALQEKGAELNVETIATLPKDLLTRLDASRAHVCFEFSYFRAKAAPVSGQIGLLDYLISFDVETSTAGETNFLLRVAVPVATLCPCSKAISVYGAHNQRGTVTLEIRSSERIWIDELIDVVEASASCELYSILKRPDEKFVTERAYENPVFVEDLVRNVASKINADSRILWYRVEAENYESIHNHNAYAVIEKSF